MKALVNLLCIFLCVVSFGFAQEAPKVKYGKPTEEELQMKTYALDTTAEAVILYDEGSSVVNYDIIKNDFLLEYERFVRIKILTQEGTVWGNFGISLYSGESIREDIMDVDGFTFNLEGGKMEKSPLKKESIFKERENKYWENIKLSMPKIKVGSVIDLHYKISSPLLWNLRPWRFQYTIPVKWSQYEVSAPEYFNYNRIMLGYHSLCKQNSTTKIMTPHLQALKTIEYRSNIDFYAAKDVPAMKEEPYLTSIENYITQIKFELASTDFLKLRGNFTSYTNTWESIAEKLWESSDFGGIIQADNFSNDVVKQLVTGKINELEKVTAIYNHVKNTMRWDEMSSIYASKPLRKSYGDKKGNSADINLTLLVMLKNAGITADPVLLSTRKHGILKPTNPTLSDFNYVIVRAVVDNVPMLLDATEHSIPVGAIPFRCLNGKGMLMRKGSAEEVPLTNVLSRTTTSVSLELINGKLNGKLISKLSGEDAYDFREGVKRAGGQNEYFEKLKNNSTGIHYLDYSYANIDSIGLPVDKIYQFQMEGSAEGGNDILYINPILCDRHQKNPFTSPTREYPVDFGYAFSANYILNFKVPEGYQVEELPKSISIVLGEKDGSYLYQAANSNGVITINIRLRIDKTLILPEEYEHLRRLYDTIVAKESEQIVLKKINKQ